MTEPDAGGARKDEPRDGVPATASSPRPARIPPAGDGRFLAALLLVQAAAAGWAAFAHREVLNPDGIAYILNAGHWARGEWGLAVNGYWGPLFSWLIAPLLAAGTEPLLAAHLVAAAGSVVFTAGAHSFLSAVLPGERTAVRLGAALAAAAGVTWAADVMTPDLLLGGLLALFASRVADDGTWVRPRAALGAGAILGAGYLAKAIALPTGVGFLCVAALAARRIGGVAWRPLLRTGLLAGAGCAAVAAPWIVALSIHYGKPTWSTTGPIAHAVVGPAHVDRYYPTFREFHEPEPGRISSWEEPTTVRYRTWSPVQDAGHFRHQIRVVGNNAVAVTDFLRNLDVLGLGLVCTVLGLVLCVGPRATLAAERWRGAAPAVLCVAGPYVVVFAYSDRYYWPAYPFLLAASFGLALRATRDASVLARRAAAGIVTASFALGLLSFDIQGFPYTVPARASLPAALRPQTSSRVTASRAAAAAIAATAPPGPIHSDVREGLYTAFFCGRPWHGQEDAPSVARLDEAGVRVFVTRADSATSAALRADARWMRIDGGSGALAVYVRRG